MDDAVDALEGAIGGLGVADVADDQLHAGRDVRRGVPVDLRLEAVEHDDLVATLEECADEVRADEAGTSGDQRLHLETILRRELRTTTDKRGPAPSSSGRITRA